MQTSSRGKVAFGIAALVALGLSAAPLPAKDPPPIQIAVDLREAPRRIFHARLAIPAAPGPLTLEYPQWIPGEHEPSGPIADLAGVRFTAGGKPLAWRRDAVDMYAFHCQVPAGADSVEVTLDYLSPGGEKDLARARPRPHNSRCWNGICWCSIRRAARAMP